MTTPTNPFPHKSVNRRKTIKSDHATNSTGITHPTSTTYPVLSPSRNPPRSISQDLPINPRQSSVINPLKNSPSYSTTQQNSVSHCQSLYTANESKNLDTTPKIPPAVAQTAPHTKPPITTLLRNQSPSKPQHPQQNVNKVLLTPNQTQQNVPSPGIKSVQLTLTNSDLATETRSTPHSLSPCSLLQRLLNELAITMTLIDRLSDLLSIDATSHSSSTLKNLFDLITELPQIESKAIILTTEPPQHLLLPAATCYNHPGQTTHSLYWYRTPPRLPCYNIASRTQYVSTETLQSQLQHTVPHSKELLKVP